MIKVEPSVQQCFFIETQGFVDNIRRSPEQTDAILQRLSVIKDTARILDYTPIYKLYCALEAVYQGIHDKNVIYSENVLQLINIVAIKINQVCNDIQNIQDESPEFDIKQELLYCDKAASGEIFDISIFKKKQNKKNTTDHSENAEENILSVHTSSISAILGEQEEMIARSYKINNQLEELKVIHDEKQYSNIMQVQRLLVSDMQVLQNALLQSHEQILSIISQDQISIHHQDMHGFFVFANSKKYFIPSDYILDVVSEDPVNYILEQNQRYYRIIDEEDEKAEPEDVPIYSLSSLFPGQTPKAHNELDTLLIAEYQGKKIGMIVERVREFVYIVGKPLPTTFKNFDMFKGFCFDEKYDMVPILSVPEILKRFRSLRGYDVKKFESSTKKRIHRILIVDDSDTTRQIEKEILTSNGFSADMACDGIQALEFAHRIQYDLVITDDVMPRMSGDILLDNLRHLENYINVPVVVMATKPFENANAFISKENFKRDNLIQTVKELLHE